MASCTMCVKLLSTIFFYYYQGEVASRVTMAKELSITAGMKRSWETKTDVKTNDDMAVW